jgi:16S rRNA (cytosine1402-N4)-methyltransferase
MLRQSVDGLKITPDGIFVDATFGGGGHSRDILRQLDRGKLIAFDQDEDAAQNVFDDSRFVFVHHNFRYLKNFLCYYDADQVDGILADLGVSSHDFDEPGRGFSFRFQGPLDMRMNRHAEITAEYVINHYSEDQLTALFREYGEIPNAGKLSSAILASRKGNKIETTHHLVEAIRKCIPKSFENKYMAQVFQALRMEINDEINALREFLEVSLEMLKPGGRLVVITYHSLEDRLVKNFMKSGNFEGTPAHDLFGNVNYPFRLINRRVIVPDAEELHENPRSRSAKLRIAEKLLR